MRLLRSFARPSSLMALGHLPARFVTKRWPPVSRRGHLLACFSTYWLALIGGFGHPPSGFRAVLHTFEHSLRQHSKSLVRRMAVHFSLVFTDSANTNVADFIRTNISEPGHDILALAAATVFPLAAVLPNLQPFPKGQKKRNVTSFGIKTLPHKTHARLPLLSAIFSISHRFCSIRTVVRGAAMWRIAASRSYTLGLA